MRSLLSLLRFKLITLIVIAAISLSGLNIIFGYLFLSKSLSESKVVIIKPNSSIKQISKILEQESVIKHRRLFELTAILYELRRPLKSGEYKFTPNITPYQVLLKITSGTSIVRKLYIPEGITTTEALDILGKEERLLGMLNASIPEGHLMPSTYFYSYGDTKKEILQLMLEKMSDNLDSAMLLLLPDSPIKTRKDLLILASIIEKEAGNNIEKPIIASVLINRLNKKMRLQADPTVIYALTQGQFRLNRALTKQDLKIDSPYNTYRVYGLPPGAICLPSYTSLLAAAQPATTDYLYFVANGRGTHNFSKTLREHINNVNKFRAKINKAKPILKSPGSSINQNNVVSKRSTKL